MLTVTKPDNTTVDYKRFRLDSNRAEYVSQGHTDIHKDMLIIASSNPKTTRTDVGNRRSSLRALKTVEIRDHDGNFVEHRDQLTRVDVSLPVTTDLAVLQEQCHKIASLLTDPDFVANLFSKGQLDY